jgi:hypothetical protein
MKENKIYTQKIFNPDFYLLWDGKSKRSCYKHMSLEHAENEAQRLVSIGTVKLYIVRPCIIYSCVKAGSKRLVYSKNVNEAMTNSGNATWFVWSRDRKTIKFMPSHEKAQQTAKKLATMYKQKYIVMWSVKTVTGNKHGK